MAKTQRSKTGLGNGQQGQYCSPCDQKFVARESNGSDVYPMREAVEKLLPELDRIGDEELRESVRQSWVRAVEDSSLEQGDLEEMPFTLLVPGCPATFVEYRRCVLQIVRRSAEAMDESLDRALSPDMEVVVAGTILADVGKLLEYEVVDGTLIATVYRVEPQSQLVSLVS